MAHEFFNRKVPPDRWKKLQAKAAEYDRKELEHAHALDNPLTGELLLANVEKEQKQNTLPPPHSVTTETASSSINAVRK